MKHDFETLIGAFKKDLKHYASKSASGGKPNPQSSTEIAMQSIGLLTLPILEAAEEYGGVKNIVEGILKNVVGGDGKHRIGFNPGEGSSHYSGSSSWMPPWKQPLMADAIHDRQGVPGTGPYGDRRHLGRRRTRAEMDRIYNIHDADDIHDDHDVYDVIDDDTRISPEAAHRRSARTGRFVDRYYRGLSRRAAMDSDDDIRSEMRDVVRDEVRSEQARRAEIDGAVSDALRRHSTHSSAPSLVTHNPAHSIMPHSDTHSIIHSDGASAAMPIRYADGGSTHSDTVHSKRGVPGTGSDAIQSAVGPSVRR